MATSEPQPDPQPPGAGSADPEPSMEEILASIKRIIAEEPPVAEPAKPLKPGRRPISFAESAGDRHGEGMSAVHDGPEAQASVEDGPAEQVYELTSVVDTHTPPAHAATIAPEAEPAALVSDDAAIASRQSLAALSAMVVKPEQGADNTLEGLVREMLRPVLKEWLDAQLPEIVERLVAQEITRITSRGV